jgi:hypothetical protein
MTPCDRILEQYCIATRYTRRSPNVLIINPRFELKVLAEMVENPTWFNVYHSLKVVHTEDIDEFQLAFVFGDTDE